MIEVLVTHETPWAGRILKGKRDQLVEARMGKAWGGGRSSVIVAGLFVLCTYLWAPRLPPWLARFWFTNEGAIVIFPPLLLFSSQQWQSLMNFCSFRPATNITVKKSPSRQIREKKKAGIDRERVCHIPSQWTPPRRRKEKEAKDKKKKTLWSRTEFWFLISCNFYLSMCSSPAHLSICCTLTAPHRPWNQSERTIRGSYASWG